MNCRNSSMLNCVLDSKYISTEELTETRMLYLKAIAAPPGFFFFISDGESFRSSSNNSYSPFSAAILSQVLNKSK